MLSQFSLRVCVVACRILAVSFTGTLMIAGMAQLGWSQSGANPLLLFKNYFVTGDYVTAGWVEAPPDNSGYAPGTISIPDTLQAQYLAPGVPTSVPAGADVVAAYLYWATVEGNQSTFAGQQAFFNGYAISGEVLGNPNAPTSWSSGGCSGSSNGSKTMRTYRADVHPYLPVDTNPASPTFGALMAAGKIPVRLADSGSNGNTQPKALGATLVIIYRQLNPPVPLNAIVLYDGAFSPSNAGLTISQNFTGFYQPATNPVAKITHIVANGQSNKGETVYLGNTALPSLYTSTFGSNSPAFPGLYGTWDNPTWVVSNMVNGAASGFDTSETTSVVPTASNSGCVSWGAMVISTTVQDSDGDGLLDVWENNQGYNDVVRENDPPNGQNDPTSGQWIALPGANPNVKDLFVEVDYMTNLGGGAVPGTPPHSHLPQQTTLDAVGATFANQHINVHFDLGPGIYPGDPFVIPYPLAGSPQAGTGGKAISESLLFCTDGAVLCPYPNQPSVDWKGGLEFVQNFKNSPVLGNFQPGRVQSYHYLFIGHSLGEPESFWGSVASPINTGFGSIQLPQLTSITVTSATSNNTTITLQAPTGQLVTPGDCSLPRPPSVCGDANNSRVSISGALGQTALNGTYSFANVSSSAANGVTSTTFTVTTSGVTPGTYTYGNEPQLGLAYLGPTSTSGHSDIGGGDSIVTLGLWGADDAASCQPDPTQPLSSGQAYCSNQVGTLGVQTGTLLHELGHSLTLTHTGTFYTDPNNPSLPSYELNCKPNYMSVMNYLFQVRGFVDGGFDYSDQTIAPLNESTIPVNAIPGLSESVGIGTDVFTGLPPQHLTRWYSAPNALDQQLQATTGTRYATVHCDGSPLLPNEPPAVRVDGTVQTGSSFSAPLDWNNDLITPDTVAPPGEDLNHNGILGDAPFSGFNDWAVLNGGNSVALQQMSGRANAFGFSGDSGLKTVAGGLKTVAGGLDDDGGGLKTVAGGLKTVAGGLKTIAGGAEETEDTATSTADPPTGLTCSDCVGGVENNPSVSLSWTAPNFGQVRTYAIWRAVGSFPAPSDILANRNLFTQVGTVSGTPPSTTFTDTTTAYQTYTYFVTEANKEGVQSAPSFSLVVTVVGGTTATSVNLSPASAVFGQLVTLTATVTGTSGTPTGTVTFSVDGNPFGSVSLSSTGTAAVQTSTLSLGNHSITASYAGNGDFSSSTSSILVLSISQASTTTTLSNSPSSVIFGQPATLTATVAPVAPGAGTPTGSVIFLDGATALGTVALSSGTASYSLSSVAAGTHSFNATYSGDTNFAGSGAPTYSLTIGKAVATVTLNDLSATYDGTPKSVTAVTNPPGLAVNITYAGSPTVPTNAGSYAVVATINSPNYQGSANGTLSIAKAGSVTTFVSDSPNPPVIGQTVTVSFKVAAVVGSAMPSGSVTVTASTGEACGPVILASGAGSCSITFSTAVSRTLTASYSGDNNFISSTSASVSQSVGDFSITVTPSAQTISSGHQAYYAISLSPIDGLTGTVSLSCSGAPPNSTCSVSPSTDGLQGSLVQSTVTLSANKNVNHGTFTFTISGTLAGEGLTHSATVQLTVK
jgi:hypothetical protein